MSWPGNVRQLRQSIERAVLMSAGEVLDVPDLVSPDEGQSRRDTPPPVGSMTMDELEQAMIVKSLAHHGGNLSRVAESLGLSRAALYRRLDKHGIRP